METENDKYAMRVRNLCMTIKNKRRSVTVVKDISFDLEAGHILGIAGESGAGKSMTMYALTGLLSAKAAKVEGEILMWGEDIMQIPPAKRQKFCSSRISIILQDAINALNPYEKIRNQLKETIWLHRSLNKTELEAYMMKLLEDYGIYGGQDTLNKYPHQLSGGMRQRIAIALALESEARILVADEPTTSLDVINQQQFLRLFKEIVEKRKLSVIYISHDLALLGMLCNDIMVLKDGGVVEKGTMEQVFFAPREAYTRTLLEETKKLSWQE
ncbi:MAG: ABC transporter ATP-binding protein [Lachnospiraceae bacterium]|nr:ABC transporter ATP-binding protein [Lachnospiraceae bacterium]